MEICEKDVKMRSFGFCTGSEMTELWISDIISMYIVGLSKEEKMEGKMLKFIVVAVIAWIVGVFGWSQIIGSLQNLSARKGLLFTMLLWIVIMGAGAYVAIVKFAAVWPLVIGYGIALVQTLSAGRIS